LYRILVVEDNAINRELLCDWLEAQGYAVQSAEDLGGTLRLLQGQQPDAVLLDVQLGSEDGLSLAAWIRRQPGFLQSGCNACISKPIDFKVLSRELGKWLAPFEKFLRRA
jgi:DNA-binding response OmpR family regulator